jgi:hypothetical protein
VLSCLLPLTFAVTLPDDVQQRMIAAQLPKGTLFMCVGAKKGEYPADLIPGARFDLVAEVKGPVKAVFVVENLPLIGVYPFSFKCDGRWHTVQFGVTQLQADVIKLLLQEGADRRFKVRPPPKADK